MNNIMSSEVRRRKNRHSSTPLNAMSSSSEATLLTTSTKRPRSSFTNTIEDEKNQCTQSEDKSLKRKYDEYAWFVVFLFAATYFVITRKGGGIHQSRGGFLSSFSKPYLISASSVSVAFPGADSSGGSNHEEMMRSIFYMAKTQKESSSPTSLALAHNHQLEVVLSSPLDLYCTLDTDKCSNINNNQQCKKKQKDNEQLIPFFSHLASTTWVHDEDLGRGYLLLADCGRSGRIWRWEVGGGPITIGRSLHMERSGCRSGFWVDQKVDNSIMMMNGSSCPKNIFSDSLSSSSSCSENVSGMSPPLLGSPSIAVELTRDAERSSVGKNIVLAEWGERRIVRIEGETGARTPLVVLVPPPKRLDKDVKEEEEGKESNESEEVSEWVRVQRPNHLLYTPFGDLLFSDNRNDVGGIVYRLKEAVHVQPISAEQSRDAHSWESVTMEDQDGQDNIDILFQSKGAIEGLALGPDYSMLYILVSTSSGKQVYLLSLDSVDDENDGSGVIFGDELNGVERASVFYSITSGECHNDNIVDDGNEYPSVGSKLSLDEKGTLYVITCSSSVTLLSTEQRIVIGTLSSKVADFFTSVGFGEDGFLYITSPNKLLRVKTRVGGMTLPTNLVVPQPSKATKKADQDKQRRQKREKTM